MFFLRWDVLILGSHWGCSLTDCCALARSLTVYVSCAPPFSLALSLSLSSACVNNLTISGNSTNRLHCIVSCIIYIHVDSALDLIRLQLID